MATKSEPVVPDALDQREKPLIRHFTIEMASDHNALDILKVRELLGCENAGITRGDLWSRLALFVFGLLSLSWCLSWTPFAVHYRIFPALVIIVTVAAQAPVSGTTTDDIALAGAEDTL